MSRPYGLLFRLIYRPPFTTGKTAIPVPGLNRTSKTVEGIWQGLKVIDGEPDFNLFYDFAGKRKPKSGATLEGWLYGDEVIDLVTARLKIYLPAFLFHWKHNVSDEIKDRLVDLAASKEAEGLDVPVYDFETNADIFKADKSYAHAHLVAYLLNGRYNLKEGKPPDPPFWNKP
jgi:hypothetical protein